MYQTATKCLEIAREDKELWFGIQFTWTWISNLPRVQSCLNGREEEKFSSCFELRKVLKQPSSGSRLIRKSNTK